MKRAPDWKRIAIRRTDGKLDLPDLAAWPQN
jgi:hypothetical protein